jgi:hypothetical protein
MPWIRLSFGLHFVEIKKPSPAPRRMLIKVIKGQYFLGIFPLLFLLFPIPTSIPKSPYATARRHPRPCQYKYSLRFLDHFGSLLRRPLNRIQTAIAAKGLGGLTS